MHNLASVSSDAISKAKPFIYVFKKKKKKKLLLCAFSKPLTSQLRPPFVFSTGFTEVFDDTATTCISSSVVFYTRIQTSAPKPYSRGTPARAVSTRSPLPSDVERRQKGQTGYKEYDFSIDDRTEFSSMRRSHRAEDVLGKTREDKREKT